MKKDYWNLVLEIAQKVGNQKVVEQANENIEAINAESEKIERRELLNNL